MRYRVRELPSRAYAASAIGSRLDAGVAQLARALAFQARCRGFESRLPLQTPQTPQELCGTEIAWRAVWRYPNPLEVPPVLGLGGSTDASGSRLQLVHGPSRSVDPCCMRRRPRMTASRRGRIAKSPLNTSGPTCLSAAAWSARHSYNSSGSKPRSAQPGRRAPRAMTRSFTSYQPRPYGGTVPSRNGPN